MGGEQAERHAGVAHVGHVEEARDDLLRRVMRQMDLHQPLRPLIEGDDPERDEEIVELAGPGGGGRTGGAGGS
jgi:hypothetical protein